MVCNLVNEGKSDIQDKKVLLEMLNLEAKSVKQLKMMPAVVKAYKESPLSQSALFFLTLLFNKFTSDKSMPDHFEQLCSRFKEIDKFEKVLEKVQEVLEVSFEDSEIEKTN